MNEHEELRGTIDRFLFQSTDSGYCIMILQLPHNKFATIVGHLSALQPGEQVTLQGSWITHPKFGRQFQAEKCTAQMPTSVLGIKKYLGSGLIKGIGKVYAKKMVEHFGAAVLDVIEKDPDRLVEIPGIGKGRIEQIKTAWKSQKEISAIMIFLQDKGISPIFSTKIYKTYGQASIALLKENPYRLAEDIWGIGFQSADTVAQKLGFEKQSIKRIKAGILHVIGNTTHSGHLYIEVNQLKKETTELLELDSSTAENNIKIALHELYNTEKIKLISIDIHHFITLTKLYYAEKGLAQKIIQLCNHISPLMFDLDKIYTSLRMADQNSVALNEDQQKAIMTCLQHKVSIVTGGPGTGKTTLIKKLISILDENKLNYRLAAPTGRAAKRMMEGTGRHAATLHRLLEFDVSTMSFTHNEQNALQLDFLIVDEASMIDTFLANALIKAMPLPAHIVFIGDIDQLPSVGAGNVLHDLIKSKAVPSVRLTHIFRQAQDSLIITNAHRINRGEFPISQQTDSRRDFIFIKEEDPENVFNRLKVIYAKQLAKEKDSIVLTPMNRGIVGAIKLNQDLQTILNTTTNPNSITIGGTLFKTQDRVMQIRNNYDKGVFNGDIGIIKLIDKEEKKLLVDLDGKEIEYTFDELNELVLAYAISIHKSQGSEYDAVIVPIFMQHFMLLQRNLIYTAITRAKKLCIFIGQPKAIAIAIKNNKTLIRQTFLKEFLTTDLTCR